MIFPLNPKSIYFFPGATQQHTTRPPLPGEWPVSGGRILNGASMTALEIVCRCTYLYICICIYIYTHTYTDIHACVFTCRCTHADAHVHISKKNMWAYAYMSIFGTGLCESPASAVADYDFRHPVGPLLNPPHSLHMLLVGLTE